MADSSSRALLAQPGENTKPQTPWGGKRTKYKLPLIIFSSLALLIGCIAASVIILLTSHEDRVGSWIIRPTVLLSILAGVYAVVLGGLFTTGVAVVWWRSIMHGTTLKRLYFVHDWASPKHFFSAFLAGGHARRVALAAVVVFAVKLAIGPLLQRSTKPEIRDVERNIDMRVDLAQEIPDGFFGTWGGLSSNGIAMSQGAFDRTNITTSEKDGYSCPTNGTCEATVAAAGLNFDCVNNSATIDLLDPKSENSRLFGISLSINYDSGLPILYLDLTYISTVADDCKATLTTETCSMIPATMWYPVSIRENIITLNYTSILNSLTIVANSTSNGDEFTEDPQASIGSLEGIKRSFTPIFTSEATLGSLNDGRATSWNLGGHSSFWADIFKVTPILPPHFTDSVARNCPLIWYSPRDYVMSHILNFMFRSAREIAGSDDNYRQEFTAVYQNQEFWYITDFGWLAASVAVMVLGNAAALFLLWGWWQLDRYVTLSPLETGKAFGAPILTTAGSEREANSIVKEVGHERVAHDGDELVWNGSVYATGAGGSLREGGGSSRETEGSGVGELSGGSAHSSRRGRGHRRGMSSVSDASPTQARPSFEHSLGITTRRPYHEEEEMDIGQYGRPRSRSRGSDTTPLIPMPLGLKPSNGGSPKLPPIPPMGSIRMEPLSPTGRARRRSRSAVDAWGAGGAGRRPLSNIEERNSPTP